jgi:hypothetical protein
MRAEREYCYTCQEPVPYNKDAASDARRRDADGAIVRRLDAKEAEELLRHELDQFRAAKQALETRYEALVVQYDCMCHHHR